MSQSTPIPVLFTLNGSSRHEIILLSADHATLDGFKHEIATISAESPNCEEFMSKYKPSKAEQDDEDDKDAKKDAKEAKHESGVSDIKVKWNAKSHDAKSWPASTVVTTKNFEAVLRMVAARVAAGGGGDVFEVTMS